MEALKPTRVETKVDRQLGVENGTLMAMAPQYKERFRGGTLQVNNSFDEELSLSIE